MSRTTLDIDKPILEEIRQLHRKENKSMGRVVSDLLAQALMDRRNAQEKKHPPRLHWRSRSLGALVDLEDKASVFRILDSEKGV